MDPPPENKQRIEWIIRLPKPEDVDQIEALMREAYGTLLRPDYRAEILETALPIMCKVRPELLSCGTWYVVEHPQTYQIVGCGGWTPSSPREEDKGKSIPHLRHVATSPKFLRKGIARAIWNRSWEDICAYYGRNDLVLEVASTITAIPFYASLGFIPFRSITIPLADNCPFPSLLMRRDPSEYNMKTSEAQVDWIVRLPQPEEVEQIEAVLRESFSTMLRPDYSPKTLEGALPIMCKVHPELLSCGTWYVVEHPVTHEIVGCGGWTPHSPRQQQQQGGESIPHLRHLATSPKFLRKGIARAVWKRSWEDMCSYYMRDDFLLEVNSTISAQPFYRSIGFKPFKQIEIPLTDNCPFPCILMRRDPNQNL